MVIAAGPNIMMNKPGKISKMAMTVSETNMKTMLEPGLAMRAAMMRTKKRRTLATRAFSI
jgi:hypothetical protein